jgi:hypothetical protein
MSAIPIAAHRFRDVFGEDASRVFRITFRDGDVLRMASFHVVDPSIYSIADQWTATFIEQVRLSAGRHFGPGTGIDFAESDIAEIFDERLGETVYVA